VLKFEVVFDAGIPLLDALVERLAPLTCIHAVFLDHIVADYELDLVSDLLVQQDRIETLGELLVLEVLHNVGLDLFVFLEGQCTLELVGHSSVKFDTDFDFLTRSQHTHFVVLLLREEFAFDVHKLGCDRQVLLRLGLELSLYQGGGLGRLDFGGKFSLLGFELAEFLFGCDLHVFLLRERRRVELVDHAPVDAHALHDPLVHLHHLLEDAQALELQIAGLGDLLVVDLGRLGDVVLEPLLRDHHVEAEYLLQNNPLVGLRVRVRREVEPLELADQHACHVGHQLLFGGVVVERCLELQEQLVVVHAQLLARFHQPVDPLGIHDDQLVEVEQHRVEHQHLLVLQELEDVAQEESVFALDVLLVLGRSVQNSESEPRDDDAGRNEEAEDGECFGLLGLHQEHRHGETEAFEFGALGVALLSPVVEGLGVGEGQLSSLDSLEHFLRALVTVFVRVPLQTELLPRLAQPLEVRSLLHGHTQDLIRVELLCVCLQVLYRQLRHRV